ncbi:MAG: hypothetical protein RL595_3002 [Planctomycetota bacterium]
MPRSTKKGKMKVRIGKIGKIIHAGISGKRCIKGKVQRHFNLGEMGEPMTRIHQNMTIFGLLILSCFTHAAERKVVGTEDKGEGSWPGAAISQAEFPEIDPSRLSALSEEWSLRVAEITAKPTILVKGQAETFTCDPNTYEWLLENPHRAVTMWKLLGAKCSPIEQEESGRYYSRDGSGTDMKFCLLANAEGLKVWLAEGQGKAGPLMPVVPIKSVIVHQYKRRMQEGTVTHKTTVYAITDSKSLTLLTKALGPSVPMLARKSVSQMQMFFGALAWYLERNPDRAESIFKAAMVQKNPEASFVVPASR